ncbi:MAG: hypothetical protein RLP44_11635 [Aggregatilineales bacterium]
MQKRAFVILLSLIGLLSLSMMTVSAGNVTLSNNGNGSAPWQITGEPSMVINGFDLNSRGITRPTQIDRVSISVARTPGTAATLVIYEDANGGSPADATLVRQQQVNITTTGTFTVDLTEPVTINQPVIWVGFYLPVGFEFNADTTGASVLTYWAWTPGGTFDITNLGSAGVLGPSDGTSPVSLNIGGVAIITAEVITDASVVTTPIGTTTNPGVAGDTNREDLIQQVVASSGQNVTPPMATYSGCETLYVDADDIFITYGNGIRFFCRLNLDRYAPPTPDGYSRRGVLYDVYAFNGPPGGIATRFSSPVTHCVTPLANDLTTAILGVAYGTPREWEILPSVRYGTLVCAELSYAGSVSYFVPSGN